MKPRIKFIISPYHYETDKKGRCNLKKGMECQQLKIGKFMIGKNVHLHLKLLTI